MEGGRRGHRAAAGARQRRRPDQLRGRRQRPRRSTATPSATSASTSRAGTATVETVFGDLEVGAGDYVILPRATTHRWVPPTATEPLRLYAIEANSHIAPPKRYLSRYGQLLEHAPYCERDLRVPTEPRAVEAATGRGLPQAPRRRAGRPGRHRARRAAAPVRRRRLGRLPLPLRVQRRRLRADHRPGAPAAAGAPGLRGPQLRGLQLRAAQGRLPPAGGAGALLPLQRRLRRGDVLRRRRLRGAQGIGHRRSGRSSLHPGGHSHGPQPGAIEASLGAERFDELAVMVDTFRPLELGEAGRACDDGEYAWSWAGGPPTAAARRCYGSFEHDGTARVGVRYGERVLDLARGRSTRRLASAGSRGPNLDRLLAGGPGVWRQVVRRGRGRSIRRPSTCTTSPTYELRLPFTVADYVDFYSSEHHAGTSAGSCGRVSPSCPPNWQHLPVGYHGRAGTVVVSGTRRRAPQRPAARADWPRRRGGLRADNAARHRGRGRVRRRRTLPARQPGAARRLRRPRVRRLPGQRLVGAGHPGLGVPAARTVPRQVVRDVGGGVGHPARRVGRGVGGAAAP